MSRPVSKPELSMNNPYWIPKHRFYELRHFCLQYPYWLHMYCSLNPVKASRMVDPSYKQQGTHSDPTAVYAEQRLQYGKLIDMVRDTARKATPELCKYLLEGVTRGYSYDILKARLNIPCGRDMYYELYRKFFWILSQVRE